MLTVCKVLLTRVFAADTHKGDGANSFGQFEFENLAYKPEYAATVLALRAELHANWQQ